MKKINKKKTTVSIDFDNAKVARHFMDWLCGSGEQEYWLWQECREREEAGDITAVIFDYDFKKFKITTEAGRVTEGEEIDDNDS